MSPTDSEIFISWLQLLPDRAEVKWQSDHLWADRPYALGWVDVSIHDFEEKVGWNWTATILSEDDPELEKSDPGDLIFTWPKDLHGLSETYGDRLVTDLDGWSPAAVSAALASWTEEHAERPDITWAWDDSDFTSPLLQIALNNAAEIEAKQAEMYEVGQTAAGSKISVHPQVMDFLAEDPERAAAIMSDFIEHLDREEASG